MPTISWLDPKYRFWLGIFFSIASAVAGGGLALKGAFPESWIPYITAWCGIIGFAGNVIQTALNGQAQTTTSRIASASADPNVVKIITKGEIANNSTFASDDKVVSK